MRGYFRDLGIIAGRSNQNPILNADEVQAASRALFSYAVSTRHHRRQMGYLSRCCGSGFLCYFVLSVVSWRGSGGGISATGCCISPFLQAVCSVWKPPYIHRFATLLRSTHQFLRHNDISTRTRGKRGKRVTPPANFNCCRIPTQQVSAKFLIRFQQLVTLRYGRHITLTGILRQPQGRRNPGGFDYRAYLARQDVVGIIDAKGYYG